jgi:hypothetical protein
MIKVAIYACFVAIVVALFLALLVAWPTQLLWNELMPTLFKCPEISFWQAFGLCILARLIFGAESSNSSSK